MLLSNRCRPTYHGVLIFRLCPMAAWSISATTQAGRVAPVQLAPLGLCRVWAHDVLRAVAVVAPPYHRGTKTVGRWSVVHFWGGAQNACFYLYRQATTARGLRLC